MNVKCRAAISPTPHASLSGDTSLRILRSNSTSVSSVSRPSLLPSTWRSTPTSTRSRNPSNATTRGARVPSARQVNCQCTRRFTRTSFSQSIALSATGSILAQTSRSHWRALPWLQANRLSRASWSLRWHSSSAKLPPPMTIKIQMSTSRSAWWMQKWSLG